MLFLTLRPFSIGFLITLVNICISSCIVGGNLLTHSLVLEEVVRYAAIVCLAFDLGGLALQAELLLIFPILQTLVLQADLWRGHRVTNRVLASHELV